MQCGLRYTTYERIQTTALMVAKRDTRREEFNRDKLINSILKACVKRPLPTGRIEKLVDEIEADLQQLGRAEIPSSHIGEMVMDRLRDHGPGCLHAIRQRVPGLRRHRKLQAGGRGIAGCPGAGGSQPAVAPDS